MIKTNHRNFQGAPGSNRFPSNLIWVARFDEIGPLPFQDFFYSAQINERAIAGTSGDQWRMNRIDSGPPVARRLSLWAGDNENVFVLGRAILDVRNFLVEITLHATAKRRIKLGQIADLHAILSFRAKSRNL